jgi:hypothetical protein
MVLRSHFGCEESGGEAVTDLALERALEQTAGVLGSEGCRTGRGSSAGERSST